MQTHRVVLAVAAVAISATPSLAQQRELNTAEQVAHVVSRLTFGPRYGDADRIAKMGVDRWIAEQLRPDAIADSAVVTALAPLLAWSAPVSKLDSVMSIRFTTTPRVRVATAANANSTATVRMASDTSMMALRIWQSGPMRTLGRITDRSTFERSSTRSVDASVAVRWMFELDRSDRAERLLQSDERLIAPDLVMAEITNAAWRLAVFGGVAEDTVQFRVAAAPKEFDELFPSLDLKDRALSIALELRHPAYDCFYLALAERRDCHLVTADDRLVRRCESTSSRSSPR